MSGDVKICKVCGIEKSVNEFAKHKSKCKLCEWCSSEANINKLNNIINFSRDDLINIVDNILNSDIYLISETLEDGSGKRFIDKMNAVLSLNIKGKKVRVKFNCDVCSKECFSTISSYKSSKNHFCSGDCHNKFMRNDYGAKEGHSVCGICEQEKPFGEFIIQKRNSNVTYIRCKVCEFYRRNKKITILPSWTKNEYDILLDLLLNEKIQYLDDAIPLLNNKTTDDLFTFIKSNISGGSVKLRFRVNCGHCNKEFGIKPYLYKEHRENYFCCNKCSAKFYGEITTKNKKTYVKTCQHCGKEFSVGVNREKMGKNKFCSPECSQQSQINKIEVNCSFCGQLKLVTPSIFKNQTNHFCNSNCEYSFKSEQAREIRKCELCDEEYETKKISQQRFCSTSCQIEWQRQNPLLGVENPNFTSVLMKCDWCGSDHYVNQYKINSNQSSFTCSDECRQAYYSNITSQTEEWKEFHRIKVVDMLSRGAFGHTDTEPQIILNGLLDKINIKYENEYNCKYVSIDNYLYQYDLMIECNGTYWHCDNRFYDLIKYVPQRDRIKNDKIKTTYIKNNYGINILHMWEFDIMNNPQLCIELINEYVNTNGVLKNYHSFNYSLVDNKISLNENIIIPYMDWDADKLSKIVDISVKKKMSQKQHNKWIQFKCECCGKDTEQLISKYNKANNHFCSWDCSRKSRRKSINKIS